MCFVYLPRVIVANYAETVEMAFNNSRNKEQFLCLAHFPMMVVAKYAEIGEMVVKLKLQTKPCKSGNIFVRSSAVKCFRFFSRFRHYVSEHCKWLWTSRQETAEPMPSLTVRCTRSYLFVCPS